jgi:hypothetical protein
MAILPASLDGAELHVISGDDQLGAFPGGVTENGGQVGHGGGAGFVQDEQRVRAKASRPPGFPMAREVAEELGGVSATGIPASVRTLRPALVAAMPKT